MMDLGEQYIPGTIDRGFTVNIKAIIFFAM
jgi:hypothetical protein